MLESRGNSQVSQHVFRVARLAVLVVVGLIVAAIFVSSATRPAAASGSTPTAAATQSQPIAFKPLPGPKQQTKIDKDAISKIDLKQYPIVPEISDSMAEYIRAIYQEGHHQGNNPSVFSKIGDCMTATPDFLAPIAKGNYNLDQYASLKPVIDRFLGAPARTPDAGFDSFSNPGLAAASGFNAAGVLDSTWSDPKWCGGDETPLTCEFRVSKPSIALIMFGTNDIKSLTPEEFDFYLRTVIVQTVNAGVVPVLSTFPNQQSQLDSSILYNKIVVKIATDYKIPMINLWLAFDPIPHQGVDPVNTTHMTKPDSDSTASFTLPDLQSGYNLRNLTNLQTLDAVLKAIGPAAAK